MKSSIKTFDLNKLKKYKAKFGEFQNNPLTLYDHIQDLLNILEQLKIIYHIDDIIYNNIKEASIYHDFGKAHREYQNDENTHFRKVRHEILSASLEGLGDKVRIPILLSHKDIKTIANRLIDTTYYNVFRKEFEEELNINTIDIIDLVNKLERSHSFLLLKDMELILIKGYLQLCDSIASAGIKEVDSGFNAYKFFIFHNYNSIQKKINNLNDSRDIIIQAMTGLGKSAASMFWSSKVQNYNNSRRIFYILPFTASINAMYNEFSVRGISTAMLHSKAQYFLSKELEDLDNDDNIEKINTKIRDQYSLFRKNVKQVTVCTIFQLVKAFFGCKNFEMLLAQMKNSIFIIDEIHTFRVKELVLIIETLRYLKENFSISMCIMSASIPTCLLNVIKEKLSINTVINADNIDLIIRHHINYYDEKLIDNMYNIETELKRGKQVLLCVNSVGLSQKIFDEFKDKYRTKLLHGKFNTRDREIIEKDLKSAELLIGTQAIEVSLNISYDVLYTEVAPLDALVQRYGRINRKGDKRLSEIHIYNDTSNVYEPELIQRTIETLKEIMRNDAGIVYEHKVNEYLDKVYLEFNYEEYNKIAKKYNALMNMIVCGEYDSNFNDLDNRFGISVLPICLRDEYNSYIIAKEYLKASGLLVNVTYKTRKMNYDKELDIIVCDYKYTSEKGLEMHNTDYE